MSAISRVGRPMTLDHLTTFAASSRTAETMITYTDAFQPADFVPCDLARLAAECIVPPLLDAIECQGLTVEVTHDLRPIAQIQGQSGGRMRLIKVNDPRFHPHASPADTNCLVLKRDGFPVGCVASRLRWCERTLAEEMQSGRFWVSDPRQMWLPQDQCLVNAYMAKLIRACPVVYVGSVYLDPSVTGGKTLAALARLQMLWLITHWRWSWTVGFVEGPLARRHAFEIYGVMSLETGVWRTRQEDDDDQLHQYHLTIIEREAAMETWLRSEIADLERPIGWAPTSAAHYNLSLAKRANVPA